MTHATATVTGAAATSEREPAAADTLFNAYAVRSRSGPHVTMQAGVLHGGRFWTTTSSDSLKTRSVDAHGVAAAVLPDGGRTRIVAGRTSTIHAMHPLSLVSDLTAPVRAPGAVLRLGVAQVEQLVGYLEASASIPAGWLPHRRVLLVTRPDRSLTLDGYDVTEVDGDWSDRAGKTGAALDVEADPHRPPSDLPHDHLPASHRPAVRLDSRVHVGVSTPTGPIAVPARWLGEDRFVTSAPALAIAHTELPGPAVAVFDQSTSRRPDEKLGVMFRGRAAVEDVCGSEATVALRTARITTWDGFEADTVSVGR